MTGPPRPVAAGTLKPGVVNGWGHGYGHSAGADVPDDLERLLERVVHAQQVLSPLGQVGRLLHEAALVCRRVQVGQQFAVDEGLGLGRGLERLGLRATPTHLAGHCDWLEKRPHSVGLSLPLTLLRTWKVLRLQVSFQPHLLSPSGRLEVFFDSLHEILTKLVLRILCLSLSSFFPLYLQTGFCSKTASFC